MTSARRRALTGGVAGVALAVLSAGCSAVPAREAAGTHTGQPGRGTTTSRPAPGTAASTSARPTAAARARSSQRFFASVQRLPRATRRAMRGVTWRPGCPVPLDDLRLVRLRYHAFTGETRVGALVLHREAAREVISAFRAMYHAGYPIRTMRLVDHYGGSDRRSMRANNTSGFNCRPVPGSSTWSQHAYGRAVDINPVQNPYLPRPSRIEPRRGRRFVDRSRSHPAVIREGDAVVRAFDRIGWGWGGRWTSLKDWQHFSANGG